MVFLSAATETASSCSIAYMQQCHCGCKLYGYTNIIGFVYLQSRLFPKVGWEIFQAKSYGLCSQPAFRNSLLRNRPGRWGSSALGGSPSKRRKTLISNLHCLVAISTPEVQEWTSRQNPEPESQRQFVPFCQLLRHCWNQLYWLLPFHWTISVTWKGGDFLLG